MKRNARRITKIFEGLKKLDFTTRNILATQAIADSLTYIFNRSTILSSFLDVSKIARVIPALKCRHRNMPGNYAPISIFLSISKIME